MTNTKWALKTIETGFVALYKVNSVNKSGLLQPQGLHRAYTEYQ